MQLDSEVMTSCRVPLSVLHEDSIVIFKCENIFNSLQFGILLIYKQSASSCLTQYAVCIAVLMR
jgi:hypothetical protein